MNDRHSLFGAYGRRDPSLDVPVSGSISPYMQYDPALVNPDSQFILLEGASAKRGRFELSFGIIGGAVMLGGTGGGLHAILRRNGPPISQAFKSNVARTKLLNSIGKSSSSAAQAWGSAALIYSVIVVLMSKVRGADDELNTLFSGTTAGMLYFSSGGLRRSLMGGAGGLGVACAYCLMTSRDRMKQMIGWS